MKINELGRTGLRVSEIGFGGSRIGGLFANKNGSKDALNILRESLDAGITFYDTADMYAQGESEALMGKAFRGRRQEVILATKGGYCIPAQRKLIQWIKPLLRPIVHASGLKRPNLPSAVSGNMSQDFSPAYLTKALEASLKRLRTDYIDLYQLHSPRAPFLQTDAFGEALQTLEKLKGQGKLRFYGVATEVIDDVPFCLSAPGISSVQLGFGLLDLEALDRGILTEAESRGLGVIARGCFGGGLLKDGTDEAQLKTATPKWQRILALRSFSEKMGRPLLDLALQFCLATRGVSTTLLGMHSENHLRDNQCHYNSPGLTAGEYADLCSGIRRSEATTAGHN